VRRNHGVAIVEPNGTLVYFQKMDGSHYAAIGVAIDKATASAIYRRPTTAFDARRRGGNTYLLTLRGMNALPGSVPIVFESKLISSAPRAARASRMFK
jgi:glc operon protein GlcG